MLGTLAFTPSPLKTHCCKTFISRQEVTVSDPQAHSGWPGQWASWDLKQPVSRGGWWVRSVQTQLPWEFGLPLSRRGKAPTCVLWKSLKLGVCSLVFADKYHTGLIGQNRQPGAGSLYSPSLLSLLILLKRQNSTVPGSALEHNPLPSPYTNPMPSPQQSPGLSVTSCEVMGAMPSSTVQCVLQSGACEMGHKDQQQKENKQTRKQNKNPNNFESYGNGT